MKAKIFIAKKESFYKMKKVVFRHQVGDSVLLFVEQEGLVSLFFVPSDMENRVDLQSKDGVNGMIQASLCGDVRFSCYSSGQTMLNSETTNSFRLKGQRVKEENGTRVIETTFTGNHKITVKNVIIFDADVKHVKTYNELKNCGTEDVTVEMLASFSLSGISPFDGDASNLRLHRMFGNWSAEGRAECRRLESAGLEQSWANYGLRDERFGAVGSMPVQRYFPFACLEACDSNTLWGVLLEAPCSWQMEVTRYNKYVALSGGQADFEYGHVRRTVRAGKSIRTDAAYLTVCHGSVDDVYNRLRESHINRPLAKMEESLPVLYNEYCDSWGGPTHDKVLRAARKAKECGAEYFVMDAGWYCDAPEKWSVCVGDFKVNEASFPHGIRETARKIREIGLIPGIWFEFECIAVQTETFKKFRDKDMFLTRDGNIITSGNRAFFDFRKKKVRNHLRKTVIDFLVENGFGYIKIDYNECVGIGCDGGESYGSALREHIDGVLDFLKEMRQAVPGLVIEACASGGHRIEPTFLGLADMTSFSDAHEGYEGAVIAANVNKLCPTRKNQIWAVVNDRYSISDIRYSMAKTFFGRMCISGNVNDIGEEKLALVKSFTSLYGKIAYILKNDENRYFGDTDLKYLSLEGRQAVLKTAKDGSGALIVVHGFKGSSPITVCAEGLSQYQIADVISASDAKIARCGDEITITVGDFDACVIHLKKNA